MLDVDSGAEYLIAKYPRTGVPRDLHLRPLAATLSDQTGWQSTASPSTITFDVPPNADSIHLIGVYSLGTERKGAQSAALIAIQGGQELLRETLISGRHFRDATDEELLDFEASRHCSIATVGCALIGGNRVRLDVLTLKLPPKSEKVIFQTVGSTTSFILFDAIFERPAMPSACPFHSRFGGVSLAELGGIVRVRDRVRFNQALQQMEAALDKSTDLDEARSEVLTFLAIVTAGMLEAGGERSLHRVQLDAARTFDQVNSSSDLKAACRKMIDRVVGSWLNTDEVQPQIVDRALSIVERNYAHDLTDDYIAGKVGMSTSHFRFLFKQSVGQPFHKFLVATRLEKARVMLEQGDMSVSEIGVSVGFGNLASFSRAFAQRFGMPPSDFRKVRGL